VNERHDKVRLNGKGKVGCLNQELAPHSTHFPDETRPVADWYMLNHRIRYDQIEGSTWKRKAGTIVYHHLPIPAPLTLKSLSFS
jgi:hypothetical protein